VTIVHAHVERAAERALDERRECKLCKKTHSSLFERFSYVCPEPVLVI
jgi:hypothetical protein